MKIEQNRIDDLNIELTLTVAAEDYAESRKKRLAEFRKKAEIKGFRKGMVPMLRGPPPSRREALIHTQTHR